MNCVFCSGKPRAFLLNSYIKLSKKKGTAAKGAFRSRHESLVMPTVVTNPGQRLLFVQKHQGPKHSQHPHAHQTTLKDSGSLLGSQMNYAVALASGPIPGWSVTSCLWSKQFLLLSCPPEKQNTIQPTSYAWQMESLSSWRRLFFISPSSVCYFTEGANKVRVGSMISLVNKMSQVRGFASECLISFQHTFFSAMS